MGLKKHFIIFCFLLISFSLFNCKSSSVTGVSQDIKEVFISGEYLQEAGLTNDGELLELKYRMLNPEQENKIDQISSDPFWIQVMTADSRPFSKGSILAMIPSDYKDAGLSLTNEPDSFKEEDSDNYVTYLKIPLDDEGKAKFYFKNGSKQQQYKIRIFLQVAGADEPVELKELKSMAIDYMAIVFSLLGGLAIFLFGMRMMSESLQTVAGEKLKGILAMLTKNRFIAVGLGFIITAIIQSSSATTVMTVGLINAGLLSLAQSIGVIMGANIGTTITGFILSFKLAHYVLPIIAVGFVMVLVGRKKNLYFWGLVVIGFALLFIGMDTMSAMLKPLKDSPSIMAFMQTFSQEPILGVLAGTAVVLLIQSSSAAMGITLVLASTGLIDLQGAFCLVLGENIGTTITAQLAALTANRRSKQAAMVHTIFNVFGVLYMLLLLYVPSPFSDNTNLIGHWFVGVARMIGVFDGDTAATLITKTVTDSADENQLKFMVAMCHFSFNMGNVIIFLPLVKVLQYLAEKIIPRRSQTIETVLDQRLLDTPALAISQAKREIGKMLETSREMLNEGIDGFIEQDQDKMDKILTKEDMVDDMQNAMANYMVELAQRPITDDIAEVIPLILHANNDVERIADLCESFVKFTKSSKKQKVKIPKNEVKVVIEMKNEVDKMMQDVLSYIETNNVKYLDTALQREPKINKMREQNQKAFEKKVRKIKGKEAIVFLTFIKVVGIFEKMGDHLTNISEVFMKSR